MPSLATRKCPVNDSMRGLTTDRAPLLSATTSHSKSTTTVTGGGVCPSFSCCFSPFILFYLPFFVQRSSQENRCSKICIRLASKASFSSSFLTLKSCKLACCCCCCCCCFFPQDSLCFTLAAAVAGRQHFVSRELFFVKDFLILPYLSKIQSDINEHKQQKRRC